MQSSHTQTAEDRVENDGKEKTSSEEKKGQDNDSVLEPAEKKSEPDNSDEEEN